MDQIVIQYTESLNDPVRLNQYIFSNELNGRFALFNFHNQHVQNINYITFTVVQYDVDNNVITKNKMYYQDFIAASNSFFVPKVKLLLNNECEYLIVYVDEARFDTDTFIEGKLKVVKKEEEKIEEEKVEPYFHSIDKLRIVKAKKLFFFSLLFLFISILFINIYVNYYL